jgi:hypothetical protein
LRCRSDQRLGMVQNLRFLLYGSGRFGGTSPRQEERFFCGGGFAAPHSPTKL